MISRILKTSATTGPALEYNERKVDAFSAAVVRVHGIPDDSRYAIEQTMRRYESNPAISARARKLAFHMTVGPGVDDDISEASVLDYIDEVMEEMGYGSRPYVVYRHNDIDREHYHVVAVNADEEGRIVRRHNDVFRLMAIQRRLAPKYGFTSGVPDGADLDLEPRPMERGMRNVHAQIRANFDEALTWDLGSADRLPVVLSAYGVEMREVWDVEGYAYTSLRGVDRDGAPLTRFVGSARVLGEDAPRYVRMMSEPSASRRNDWATAQILSEVLPLCTSVEELSNALLQLQIHLHLATNTRRRPRDARDVTAVYLADMRRHTVTACDDLPRGCRTADILERPLTDAAVRKNPLPAAMRDRLLRHTPERTEERGPERRIRLR